MPIVKALMDNLIAQYGEARGKDVYYAMEASGRGPFAPHAKHYEAHLAFAADHNAEPISGPTSKPVRAKGPGGPRGKAPAPMHKARSTPAPKR